MVLWVYIVTVETTAHDAKFVDAVYRDKSKADDIVDAYKRAGHIAYVVPSLLID